MVSRTGASLQGVLRKYLVALRLFAHYPLLAQRGACAFFTPNDWPEQLFIFSCAGIFCTVNTA